jgi:hypothetical protein
LVFEVNNKKIKITPKGSILWVIWFMLMN